MAFPVNARGTYSHKFTVPAGALNPTLNGRFVADGGSGKDTDVVIVSEDEYVNWQNGHPTKALYKSGKVTQDTHPDCASVGPGQCHLLRGIQQHDLITHAEGRPSQP